MSNNPLSNPLLNKAKLLVPLATGAAYQNNDGNWATDETTEEYLAYFKKPGKQPVVNNNSGVDGFSVYLKGYLVEPKFLPANLKLPVKVECIRMIGDREQKGTFEIRPSLSPVPLIGEIIGQQIEGWLFWE